MYIQDGGRVSPLPYRNLMQQTTGHRIPEYSNLQNNHFEKVKRFLFLLSVYKTFRSEAKTVFLDAHISCPTALLVIELPFYLIIKIWNGTFTIWKYSAVAAFQTCIQPYSSLDQATGFRIYRFL